MLAAALGAVATAPAIADQAAVERGTYLAGAAGCDECHTDKKNGGQPFAGGRRMATGFGVILTPNITPDRPTGIGAWSEADFVRAMRWGIAPDGTHYVPAFPFRYYGRLTDADLADLKAYLDSLAPVARPDLGAAGSLALLQRARAAVGSALRSLSVPKAPVAADPVIGRGAYLANTVGLSLIHI